MFIFFQNIKVPANSFEFLFVTQKQGKATSHFMILTMAFLWGKITILFLYKINKIFNFLNTDCCQNYPIPVSVSSLHATCSSCPSFSHVYLTFRKYIFRGPFLLGLYPATVLGSCPLPFPPFITLLKFSWKWWMIGFAWDLSHPG